MSVFFFLSQFCTHSIAIYGGNNGFFTFGDAVPLIQEVVFYIFRECVVAHFLNVGAYKNKYTDVCTRL